MRYLLLLFIVMPIVEIGVLINVGSWLGLWPTLLIVILTAVLGTWMLRQQSAATMMQAQDRLRAGELPAQQIFEGVLLLVGGVLLLTPGFVTDGIGFACLMPWSRRWLAAAIAERSKGGAMFINVNGSTINPGAAPGPARGPSPGPGRGPASSAPHRPSNQQGDVIEGDYREVD